MKNKTKLKENDYNLFLEEELKNNDNFLTFYHNSLFNDNLLSFEKGELRFSNQQYFTFIEQKQLGNGYLNQLVADYLIERNGIIIGVEIKSDSDNLNRIKKQLLEYVKYCHLTYVFCADKFNQSVLDLINSNEKFKHVGIINPNFNKDDDGGNNNDSKTALSVLKTYNKNNKKSKTKLSVFKVAELNNNHYLNNVLINDLDNNLKSQSQHVYSTKEFVSSLNKERRNEKEIKQSQKELIDFLKKWLQVASIAELKTFFNKSYRKNLLNFDKELNSYLAEENEVSKNSISYNSSINYLENISGSSKYSLVNYIISLFQENTLYKKYFILNFVSQLFQSIQNKKEFFATEKDKNLQLSKINQYNNLFTKSQELNLLLNLRKTNDDGFMTIIQEKKNDLPLFFFNLNEIKRQIILNKNDKEEGLSQQSDLFINEYLIEKLLNLNDFICYFQKQLNNYLKSNDITLDKFNSNKLQKIYVKLNDLNFNEFENNNKDEEDKGEDNKYKCSFFPLCLLKLLNTLPFEIFLNLFTCHFNFFFLDESYYEKLTNNAFVMNREISKIIEINQKQSENSKVFKDLNKKQLEDVLDHLLLILDRSKYLQEIGFFKNLLREYRQISLIRQQNNLNVQQEQEAFLFSEEILKKCFILIQTLLLNLKLKDGYVNPYILGQELRELFTQNQRILFLERSLFLSDFVVITENINYQLLSSLFNIFENNLKIIRKQFRKNIKNKLEEIEKIDFKDIENLLNNKESLKQETIAHRDFFLELKKMKCYS